jgi:hypothetical protein
MADPNFPRGDTTPPLRMCIRDQAGLVDLTAASRVTLYAVSASDVITGAVTPIDPPEPDAADPTVLYNALYDWQAGDTDAPGEYRCQVEAVFAGETITYPNGQDGQAAWFTFFVVDRVASAADVGP